MSRGRTCCLTWSAVANPTSVARVARRSIGGHHLDLSAVSARVVSTCRVLLHTFNPSEIPSRVWELAGRVASMHIHPYIST